MILIQRYIFKELVYNFVFSFVVISVVVLLASMMQVLFKNPEVGLDMVVRVIPLMVLGIMSIVFPAASLVSVVTTYGRMASDNELAALSSSGVHFLRVVVPGVLFGLLVSLALLVANDRFVPEAQMKGKSLLREQDIHMLLDNIVKRGVTTRRFNDWNISWQSCERVDDAGGEESGSWLFRGFLAILFDEDNNVERKIHAERAVVAAPKAGGRTIEFQLHNFREFGGSGGSSIQARYMKLPFTLDSRPSTIRLGHRSLSALIALIGKTPPVYSETRILSEIHSRIAQSLSPLVMIFLGLSVAVIFRYRNRMVAFFIALMLAIFIYYPVMLLGETFAKSGTLHPALCIWPGNAIMFFGGIFLLMTVTRR
jgi:lipopolysaccharide export system permease protein